MTTHDFRATPLLGRMQQVAMTYLTRPFLAWACGLGSLCVLALTTFLVSEYEGQEPVSDLGILIVQTVSLPALLLPILLVWHTKWQFVNPVTRLAPNYRAPHIGLLASLTLCVLGAFPFLFGMKLGLSPIGLAALAIAVSSPVLWGTHNNNGFVAIFSSAIFLFAMYPPITQFWFDPNRAYGPNHLGILLLGWGFIVAWLRSLITLHEERSDYNIPPIAAQFGRASRSERAEHRKLIARSMKKIPLQGWLADRSIDQEITGPPPSSPQLLRHGAMALSAEWRAVMWFLMFGGMSLALVMFADRVIEGNIDTRQGEIGFLMMPMMFALFMPGSFLSQLFVTRRPFMESELLRPMTRKDYLMGVIRAGLRDTAIQAVAFVGIAFVLVGCFSPGRMTPFSILAFLCAVVACNFFVASFNIWAASYRIGMFQFFLPMLSMVPIALVGLGLSAVWWKMTKGNPGMLEQMIWSVAAIGLASILPLLGLFFLRKAKRRWMEVELG